MDVLLHWDPPRGLSTDEFPETALDPRRHRAAQPRQPDQAIQTVPFSLPEGLDDPGSLPTSIRKPGEPPSGATFVRCGRRSSKVLESSRQYPGEVSCSP